MTDLDVTVSKPGGLKDAGKALHACGCLGAMLAVLLLMFGMGVTDPKRGGGLLGTALFAAGSLGLVGSAFAYVAGRILR